MKNKILICLLSVILLTGCNNTESLKHEAENLKAEISILKEEKEILKGEVTELKEKSENSKYVVTFEIRQRHFTLDLSQHIKDEMNEITIQIPVDMEYYNSIEIGDTIADDFRFGSFIMKGSYGNWEVKVIDKEIQ